MYRKLGTLLLLWIMSSIAIYSAEEAQLITHLKKGEKQTLVLYGTSLTANGAWVQHLTKALDEEYPELVTVVNSGGAGKWSEWGVENLKKRVMDKNPDTVFIEFSINDCVERFKADERIARKNLETMIDKIRKDNPNCEIILMTMTPGNKHPKGHKSYRKDIHKHYEMYREVAKKEGLLLIDHYPNWIKLQQEDKKLFAQYVPDYIHPKAEGNLKVVTPVILEAIGL